MRFIGRKLELKALEHLLLKKSSSLVVIWGRRRIGKSRLVEQFVKDKKVWSFSGLPPHPKTTKEEEIKTFLNQMVENTGMPEIEFTDWGKVFWFLGNLAKQESKLVIFFDEISWMGSKDHNFLGHLKTEWDRSFSKHPNLIFIMCGSISNWIEKNILSSTGFLGRISVKLEIKELPLEDCNKFWPEQNKGISAYEKLKILGITGGVPKYLEEIIPNETAENNINRLCFRPDGLLFREYDQIFSDLFSRRAHTFDKIIKVLAEGSKNLEELCDALKIQKSGNISSYLQELASTGFISEDPTWNIATNKVSNLKTFRLKDNYIRFYLKFIEPNKSKIVQLGFSTHLIGNLPSWEIIMGLQFENLVINNLVKLCKLLEIEISDIEKAGPFFQKASTRQKGCQIDLLIQTKSNILYVCEIKFYRLEIGKKVVEEVKNKIERLFHPKGYSIRPILIHINGVTEGVLNSGFFSNIIDFSDFL